MMNSNLISSMFRKSTLSHRFTIITVMFVAVLLGLLIYTIATIQKEKSNAILIDMAGRQRMLFQKHMNEVFLTSQGVTADYTSTRELLRSTLHALMEGGSVVLDLDTGKKQKIPAIPTEEISLKLREQENHFDEIIELGDDLLLLAPGHPEFRQKLKLLRARNSTLIAIADDAVKQLDSHAESIMATMVKWESIIALFVGLLGIHITRQGIRDGKKIEKEILERTRAESALRDNEMFLNSIVEDIPDMIFIKDAKNLQFLRINKAGEELLGRSRESLIGKTDYDFFPQEQATFFTTKDHEVLANKNSLDIPEEIIHTNIHGTRYLHTKKIPILDNHGIPQYLLGISQDITERKQAEERLRQSEAKETEVLRQSDELKSALLASVSHELRTPLTAMKGSVSSIMGNGSTSKDQEREGVLKGIDSEINYMSHLVDNLLDMSQIEAGTLMPHKEWHLLEDLVEGALRRTAQTLDTRNIEISIPENIPPIFVDAVEMQQVLMNLIDNAVKYSSLYSPIQLLARVGPQQIEVLVSNTGEPIQAQDLERIFERFFRGQPPSKEPIRGTGLGLAICKGIIEAHGGRIWAESIGREVKITFTIPVTESMANFSLEGLHKG